MTPTTKAELPEMETISARELALSIRAMAGGITVAYHTESSKPKPGQVLKRLTDDEWAELDALEKNRKTHRP